ncbi:MAG: DUF1461 domain-containing protein [Clostridia bacterium]|nr:DUF1461 domain-containing protein [Clostridia bacterium]
MRRALCFCAGLVLALTMVLISIAGPATRTGLFVRALVSEVDQTAAGVTQEQLAAFGEETMRYLRSEKDIWEPQIPAEGIPHTFRDHMAEVRGWISALPWVIGAGIIIAVLCMLRGFERRAFLWGMGAFVWLVGLIVFWALIDFGSLWMVIHRLLIPNGIFSAREPVMRLFPLSLFFRYIPWVLGVLILQLALVLAACFIRRRRHKGQI